MSVMKIAFIGLGRIGYPIALNLGRGEGEYLAFDPQANDEQRTELKERGWSVAGSLSEVGGWRPDVLFTVLPNSQIVETVLLSDELLAGLSGSGICVDMSTGYPDDSAALAAELAKSGVRLVEAPICSGAVPGAYAGRLTLAVSGETEAVATVRPYLERVASDLVDVPAPLQAQMLKLMTNYVVMGTHAMGSELLALGTALGFEEDDIFGLLSRCAAGNLLNFKTLNATMFSDEEVPLFRTELATKDLRYASRIAAEHETLMLLGDAVHQYFLLSQLSGHRNDEGLTSLWKMLKAMDRPAKK